MPATTCPSGEDLKAYAWGELPVQHADALADHLEACPRCEATVQTLERQGDTLLATLRLPVQPDPYQEEPECRQVVERVIAGITPAEDPVAQSPATLPPPLACPGRFREYDLLEKLGEGGMGAVYKARHRQLGKLVAVKILPPALAQDPQRIARFKREMRAVGQLDDPHIVRAMDAGEADQRHYLVMEHVEGLDLSKILDRIGPLAVADACEIVRQTAVGLRAADERGLVHRDIKPSNLMLAADGQVKILDLGLAVFEMDWSPDGETTANVRSTGVSRNPAEEPPEGGTTNSTFRAAAHGKTTAYGQIVGTPDYIAPEQVSDTHGVDIRADIYSLGCTLYKLLTGKVPFAGPRYRSAAEKMAAHARDPMPPIRGLRPQVPEKLAALLDRMLAKDRDLRIPTPGRVVNELATFCGGSDLAGLLDRVLKGPPPAVARAQPQDVATASFPGLAVASPPSHAGQKGTVPFSLNENRDSPPPRPLAGEGQGVRRASPPTPAPKTPQPAANPPGAQPVVAAVNIQKDAKKSDLDPYYLWLGIPPQEQPPNHYRLLAVQVFESNPEVIREAVMRQSGHLRTYQLGKHVALTQKLLNEVSAAKVCLLDPQRKAAYDARLRKELEAKKTPASPQTSSVPTAEPPASEPTPRVASATSLPAAEPALDPALAALFAEVEQSAQRSGPKAKRGHSPRPLAGEGQGVRAFLAAKAPWTLSLFARCQSAVPPRFRTRGWLAAAGGAALAGVLLFGLVFKMRTPDGILIVEFSDPEATMQVLDAQGTLLIERKAGAEKVEIKVVPGKRKLRVVKNGVELLTKEFSLVSGGRETINARLESPMEPKSQISNLKSPIPPPAIAPFDEKKAKEHQEAWAKHLGVPVEMTNSIGMKLVLIPPGEFDMGSPKELIEEELRAHGDDGWYSDRLPGEAPRHRVRITKPYWLGITEVTQEEYERVMGSNPSKFQGDPKRPVEQVSWNDAVEFCRRLSELPGEKGAKRRYQLPTEAQWEHACRAGNPGRWCFSERSGSVATALAEKLLGEYGWFNANAGGQTHAVGQKWANVFGLYDMYGNVWEWCQDWYDRDYYAKLPTDDPMGPPGGSYRVGRGGGWFRPAGDCRSASRSYIEPGGRNDHLGFRVSLVLVDNAGLDTPPGGRSPIADSPSPTPPPAIAPFDAKKAKEHQEAWAKHLGVPVELTNSIGMKLVLIPPGEFMMGTPKELIEEELERPDNNHWYKERLPGEGPQHRVRIIKPFYLGVYDVTQGEYEKVMGNNPSEFSATGKQKDKVGGQDTKRFPVEFVSWDEAVEFCGRLSNMPEEKAARRWYRLPSEAQWEYACRAGSTGHYSFSTGRNGVPKESEENELSDYGWFNKNCGGMPHAVGLKRGNPWSLYDMHGNVWEWCQDWYDRDYYAKLPTDDPMGPPGGSYRVHRGGSWGNPARGCRSANRSLIEPGLRYNNLGFRASLVPADDAKLGASPAGGTPSAGSQSPIPNPQSPIPAPQSPAPPPAVAPLNRLDAASTHGGPSLPKIVFGEWFPLFTSPDQLVGWERSDYPIRYSHRILELRNRGDNMVYPVIAKDVSIRAKAKMVSGQDIHLVLRQSYQGAYEAWFNGGRRFGIGKAVRVNSGKGVSVKFVGLIEGDSRQPCNDFFDFEFSAVGDTLTLSVNGQPLLVTHDSTHTAGTVDIGALLGSGLFKDVALFIPTKESLLADNRKPPPKPDGEISADSDHAAASPRKVAPPNRLDAASTRGGPSLPKIVFGEWFPLFTSPDQLVGWERFYGPIRYSHRILEMRDGGDSMVYPVIAKDVSVRAKAKKVSGQNISIALRRSDNGCYSAWFNGGRRFGIGKFVSGKKYVDLIVRDSPQPCNDFVDFEFSAVGDTLTLSVNGQPLLVTHDSTHTAGTVLIGAFLGSGLFKDVAIFIPTKESLVADNR
ncbi:MAG: SUMF1/EgtB/PvdO family nonheme iron enzyme [Thermoguttaceae bacterium]